MISSACNLQGKFLDSSNLHVPDARQLGWLGWALILCLSAPPLSSRTQVSGSASLASMRGKEACEVLLSRCQFVVKQSHSLQPQPVLYSRSTSLLLPQLLSNSRSTSKTFRKTSRKYKSTRPQLLQKSSHLIPL